mgnify:CR=1 FL=1
MSTKGNRDFRPLIHFTPPSMWMNDPNGMVYINGVYHLFYQHYPYDTVWGPMYWGHAVSRDLLNWEHLPIALHPDELGYIFSGSCVYDRENTSGYGMPENPPIIAIYTSHDNNTGLEQQSIAYSTDGGKHFEKSYLNPVIPNPGVSDFRDPKVFWNPVKNCWSLVLAAYDRVQFYASKDMKRWEKTGEFGCSENRASGVFECPDLFCVHVDGQVLWVLLVSMTTTVEDGKSRTQYFVGEFDGETYICTYPAEEPLWVDFGFDNYAGVTFQNYDEPLFIGWAQNWGYAASVPTNEFCGQMSLGRKLALKKVGDNYRLCGKPEGIQQYRSNAYPIESGSRITTETFGMRIRGNGDARLYLKNAMGQSLLLEIEDGSIAVDRSMAGRRDFHDQFMTQRYSRAEMKRLVTDGYEIELIFDISVLEVFADGGLEMCSMLMYPDVPYDKVEWQGDLQVAFYKIR